MSKPAAKPKVIVIVGPTASGKSDLAVKVARKIGGEVISADSRQVYRGLDVGSGKITEREMHGVPHHLLDVASPTRTFTVTQYQRLALRALKQIIARGNTPIITGGTALYIDALLYNYKFPNIKPDLKLRKKLESQSVTELFAQLSKLDPARAATIDKHNPRRLIRALEIVIGSGAPVPELKKESPYDVVKIGISISQEELANNIHTRLAKRLKGGKLTKEVRGLITSGVSFKRLDDFGLEYRWVTRYLHMLISKEEMIAAIEKESLQYAKRQMTWWKRDKDIVWGTKESGLKYIVAELAKK
jgi:tRNA dimethylallyltransferase